MNLRGEVGWEVLPGEHSEEEAQLNLGVRGFHIFGSSTVGHSEFSGYPSFRCIFLAVT
jgi:hypothetical protein